MNAKNLSFNNFNSNNIFHLNEEKEINNKLENIIKIEGDEIKINLTEDETDVGEFPLLNNDKCDECGKDLTLNEKQISELFKESLDYKKYCLTHNKFICLECSKLIFGNYIIFQDKCFHNECIKCYNCKKMFNQNDGYVSNEDKIFHAECKDEFLKRIQIETVEDEKCRIDEMEKYEADLSNDRSTYFI